MTETPTYNEVYWDGTKATAETVMTTLKLQIANRVDLRGFGFSPHTQNADRQKYADRPRIEFDTVRANEQLFPGDSVILLGGEDYTIIRRPGDRYRRI